MNKAEMVEYHREYSRKWEKRRPGKVKHADYLRKYAKSYATKEEQNMCHTWTYAGDPNYFPYEGMECDCGQEKWHKKEEKKEDKKD